MIIASSLEEATKFAYKSEKYRFRLNNGLVDIKEKFRYFDFCGTTYIAKQVEPLKGLKEVQNAYKLKEVIKHLQIYNYDIKVIIPKLVIDDEKYYCVSPYKGVSLENYYYNRSISTCFSMEILCKMLQIFIKKGIYYYDFLPRNTIMKDKKIYLIDFENIIFQPHVSYDIRWHTNFLLNWAYIFDSYLLEKQLNSLLKKENILNNYPLSNFENIFKKIVGINGDNTIVRKIILKTVLLAERSSDEGQMCGLVPMDLCHFVSDFFGSDIDAFLDILFFLIRNADEKKFTYFLNNLNKVIANNGENLRKELEQIFLKMKEFLYIKYNQSIEDLKSCNIIDFNIIKFFKKEILIKENGDG